MDERHNIVIGDRLLDLIRATRLELRKATTPYPAGADDGRLRCELERAGDALFAVVVDVGVRGYRELTDYDYQLSADSIARRPVGELSLTYEGHPNAEENEPCSRRADTWPENLADADREASETAGGESDADREAND